MLLGLRQLPVLSKASRPAASLPQRPCWLSVTRKWQFSTSLPLRTYSTAKEKPYYITTPIFYVNADPHVGHLYTMVLTDILKRWQYLRGRPALLCTGTDEHGMKIQQAALQAKIDPKEFCDSGAGVFKRLAHEANVDYSTFIRTSDPAHRDAVQYIWQMLEGREYIYMGSHQGWYSVSDETFYPPSSVESTLDPRTGKKIIVSKESGSTVEWTSEENYHFRLSAMAPKLLEFYRKNPNFIVPQTRYDEVVSAVERGLEDLSISRPRERLTWGIQVPDDPNQTIYVWLDALVNYITAAGYPWTPGQEQALGWPADVHVVGKDIVKFHCIYWPAFLLALDLPLPKQVLTHAHWTMNRRKMSKSVGNVVNPFYAIQRFGVDTMRFYMANDGGIIDDGDYSNEKILDRYKNILQGGLGNLVNRVCAKVFDIVEAREQGLDGVELTPLDEAQREVVATAASRYSLKMDKLDVPGALREALHVVSETNRYLQDTAPWTLRDPARKEEQNKIIYLAAEGIRIAGILLQPVIPGKAGEVLSMLGVEEERRSAAFAGLGSDDRYGVGTKGKKGMIFPPLS